MKICFRPMIVVAFTFVLFCGQACVAQKPNFVITIAGDHGVYHSSVYGATEFQTPNLQQLVVKRMKEVNDDQSLSGPPQLLKDK